MGRPARFSLSIVTLVVAAFVGGCSGGIGGKSPPPTYELNAAQEFPRRVGSIRGQLIVTEPTALALLDTDRIMVRLANGQTEQLANAQWEDRLPKLLQARIVQSFENGKRLRAVGKPGDKLTADYQLISDVRAFQISADSGTADIEIAAKIVNDRAGRIRAARVFKVSVPAESTEGAAAIAALNEAFNRAVVQLVLWTSQVI
jgi:cholesterol transport system auxiliary component